MDNRDLYIENLELVDATAWDGESTGVEPGDYIVAIADIEKGMSKKENPLLVVTYQIVSFADGSDTSMKDRKTITRYPLNGKAIGRLKHFMDVLGLETNKRGGANFAEAIGTQLAISVYKKDYEDMDMDGNSVTKSGTQIFKERAIEVDAPKKSPTPPNNTKRGNSGQRTMHTA